MKAIVITAVDTPAAGITPLLLSVEMKPGVWMTKRDFPVVHGGPLALAKGAEVELTRVDEECPEKGYNLTTMEGDSSDQE
ncbi:MAG TPA: hypothetical protein VLG09_03235 [Candidatus Saccharimonadales bacterium]|jgi:hypothetical protein|nr:hypothetical protein [Candidatus Saccharimonadales bacterium]